MATSFDRWEKDPFFPTAEEVQESADRMESTYRTLVHAKKNSSTLWDTKELRRDLQTTLGTTKWQLEEFARAVRLSYVNSSTNDARERHRLFISVTEDHISRIETSLKESIHSGGNKSLPWVSLDEGERDEFAAFLLGPPICEDNNTKEDMSYGHRRTASAGVDTSAWKISIDEEKGQQNLAEADVQRPPKKIPSLSVIVSSIESMPKLKWPKNGFRKWKAMDRYEESDSIPLHSSHFTRVSGINSCYEKSKSCLDSCDECYDKPLYGWYGALQRRLQRSQYQMQYGRPIQSALWIFVLFFFIEISDL
ncbi:hypothetical protein LINPERPRIM_LOCUS32953 [Linum perenne]